MSRSYATIGDAKGFSAAVEARRVARALKEGDKEELSCIITALSNRQRQELKQAYFAETDKKLVDVLEKATSGFHQTLLRSLLFTPVEYDIKELHRAIKGLGTDESALTEIICSRTPEQLRSIRKNFQYAYGDSVEKWVEGDTSGDYKDILIALLTKERDESDQVDASEAKDDAYRLYSEGRGKTKAEFLEILTTRNKFQLRKIFAEYESLSGMSIEKAIEKEFSGDAREAYLTIVASATDRKKYFAARLYKSMVGWGTRDLDLIRAVIYRSEVDLKLVKDCYRETYEKSLEEHITGDTSKIYRDTLLMICKGNI